MPAAASLHKLVNSSVTSYDANSELPVICQHEFCEPLRCKHTDNNPCYVPMTNHDKKLKRVEQNIVPYKSDVDPQIEPSIVTERTSDKQTEMNLLDDIIADNILANALLPPSAVNVHDIVSSTLDKKELMFIRDKLNTKYGIMQDNSQVNHHPRNFSHNKGAVGKAAVTDAQKNYPSPIGSTAKSNVVDVTKSDPQNGVKPITAEKLVSKPISEVVQSTCASNIAPTFVHNKAGFIQSRNKPSNAISNSPQAHNVASNANSLDNKPMTMSSMSPQDDKYNIDRKEEDLPKRYESSTLPSDIDNTNCIKGKLSGIKNVQSAISYSENLQNQVFPFEPPNCKANHQPIENNQQPDIDSVNVAVKGLTVESSKPQNCEKCRGDINVGDVVVTADKAKNILWHPGCFVCSACNELLVDLVYFYYKNQLYCGRDLAALLGIPRCFACDEVSKLYKNCYIILIYVYKYILCVVSFAVNFCTRIYSCRGP